MVARLSADQHELVKEQTRALRDCGVVLGPSGLELSAAGLPLNRDGRRALAYGLIHGEDLHTACLKGLLQSGYGPGASVTLPLHPGAEVERW